MKVLHFIFGFVWMASTAVAQDEPATPNALVCQFTAANSAVAHDGAAFETRTADDTMSMTFAAIDVEHTTAQIIGNMGTASVYATRRGDLLTFLEFTLAGNVVTTSVLLLPGPAFQTNQFSAVHSRHVAMLGDLVVSQYVGACEPRY